jgi:NPCBM-associated, NEW3 domain of alpha-galactosidase
LRSALAIPLLILALAQLVLADSVGTEGGNITVVNLPSALANSSWSAFCGSTSPNASSPLSITATPGNVNCLVISTGSSSCANGVSSLNLIFSNSSSAIVSLTPGNLSVLDAFVNRAVENGSNTFTATSTFTTSSFGNISSVPTAYTEPAAPQHFREGYLQDSAGNLAFITPVVSNQTGFNGSPMDFQIMLPTNSGAAVQYYLDIDLSCISTPPPPPPQPPVPGIFTIAPGFSIKRFPQIPNITLPETAPNASDLRLLRFTPFRDVIPGDNIIISPLLENPTSRPIKISLSIEDGGAALAQPVSNVFIAPGEKVTVPLGVHIPDDMPSGYYSLVLNVSTSSSEISYPTILHVLDTYGPDQPAVERQFTLDYETGQTLVSLTLVNRGTQPLSHVQVFESVPTTFTKGSIPFTTEFSTAAGEGSTSTEGNGIRWDLENVLPSESRTLFYSAPVLLNDLSDYSRWNLAQMILIGSTNSEIIIQDLRVPSVLPGEAGEASFTLFNGGAVTRDVELDVIGPQGWTISPSSMSFSIPSREAQSASFSVQSPPLSDAGTYGLTLRIKYGETFYDRQIFVYLYKPAVEFYAPPMTDQFVAWAGANAGALLFMGILATFAAIVALALFHRINAPRYSKERVEDLKIFKKIFDEEG